jgi:hypothetical protein
LIPDWFQLEAQMNMTMLKILLSAVVVGTLGGAVTTTGNGDSTTVTSTPSAVEDDLLNSLKRAEKVGHSIVVKRPSPLLDLSIVCQCGPSDPDGGPIHPPVGFDADAAQRGVDALQVLITAFKTQRSVRVMKTANLRLDGASGVTR